MGKLDIDFLEKVKLPEYASYGWSSAVKDMQALIQEVRILERRLVDAEGGVPCERSDEQKPA